ncbi:hypothetical protein PDM93_28340 [Bacillus cereus]|nr:hypothetical protein [Bacillus cereus]
MISFMMKSNHSISLLSRNILTYYETCLAKRLAAVYQVSLFMLDNVNTL